VRPDNGQVSGKAGSIHGGVCRPESIYCSD